MIQQCSNQNQNWPTQTCIMFIQTASKQRQGEEPEFANNMQASITKQQAIMQEHKCIIIIVWKHQAKAWKKSEFANITCIHLHQTVSKIHQH